MSNNTFADECDTANQKGRFGPAAQNDNCTQGSLLLRQGKMSLAEVSTAVPVRTYSVLFTILNERISMENINHSKYFSIGPVGYSKQGPGGITSQASMGISCQASKQGKAALDGF